MKKRKTITFKGIQRNLNTILFKIEAFFLLLSFVLFIFYPSFSALSNPVVPYALMPEQFDADEMRGTIQQANALRNVSAWDTMITEKLGVMKAAWENDLNTKIQNQIALVTESDTYNNNPTYKDYLKKELESRREEALEDWQKTADGLILTNRNEYVAFITSKYKTEQDNSTTKTQTEAENKITEEDLKDSYSGLKDDLDSTIKDWATDFNTTFKTGMTNFQNDLTSINTSYSEFIQQLNQAEGEFNRNLSLINAYKTNVKTNIQTMVNNLQTSLNSDSNTKLYKNDDGSYNTAGENLNKLITRMNTKLQNPDMDFTTILTELSTEMTDYLELTKNEAQSKTDYYQTQIIKNYKNDGENESGSSFDISSLYWSRSGDPTDQAFQEFIGLVKNYISNPAQYSTEMLQRFSDFESEGVVRNSWLSDNLIIQNITGVTLRANTTNVDADWLASATRDYFYVGGSYNEEVANGGPTLYYHYNEARYISFDQYVERPGYCIVLPVKACWYNSFTRNEKEIYLDVSYTVKDTVAEQNMYTWQGFTNQLAAQHSEWKDKILPAISNWEQQVKNYKGFFDAWKTKADELRAEATENYQNAVSELQINQGKWRQEMERSEKAAIEKWSDIQKKLQSDNKEEAKEAWKEAKLLADSVDELRAPEAGSNSAAFTQSILDLRNARVEYKTEELPSTNGVASLAAGFNSSINGSLNNSNNASPTNSYNIFDHGFKVDDISNLNIASKFNTAITGAKQFNYVRAMNNIIDENVNKYQDQVYEQVVNSYKFKIMSDYYTKDGKLDESKLTAEQLKLQQEGKCVSGGELVAACAGFMERNEMFESARRDGDQIVITYKISDGSAHKAADGKGDYKGYESGNQFEERRISLSSVAHVGAPKDLFETWTNADYQVLNASVYGERGEDGKLVEGKEGALASLYNSFGDDMKRVGQSYQDVSELNQYYMDMFRADADQQIEREQLVEDLVKAYVTGGGSWSSAVQSVVKDKVNNAIAEATGLPVGLISGLTSGQSFKQAAQGYAKQVATQEIAKATGLPPQLVSQWIAKQTAPKPGFTESPAFKAVKVVAAVAAVVAAPFTGGASLVALGAFNAAVSVAEKIESGGIGSSLKSVVANVGGAVINGVVSGATGGVVDANLSYSEEDGFGASVGVGVAGVASVGLEYTENGGFGAYAAADFGVGSVELSYSQNNGFEAQASLDVGFVSAEMSYDTENGFQAQASLDIGIGAVDLNYSDQEGFSAHADVDIGVGDLSMDYSDQNGFSASASVEGVVDLSYDKNGLSASTNIEGIDVAYSSSEGFSASGEIAGVDLSYDKNGLSASTNIEGIDVAYSSSEGFSASGEIAGVDLSYDKNGLSASTNIEGIDVAYSSSEGFSASGEIAGVDLSYDKNGLSASTNIEGIDVAYSSSEGFSASGEIAGVDLSYDKNGLAANTSIEGIDVGYSSSEGFNAGGDIAGVDFNYDKKGLAANTSIEGIDLGYSNSEGFNAGGEIAGVDFNYDKKGLAGTTNLYGEELSYDSDKGFSSETYEDLKDTIKDLSVPFK
ncbi:MAG: TIGR04388 family protein [Leptospiraceae bacterium]|nr:TIGR04388 family protein [Leptospiraceae bacterium]